MENDIRISVVIPAYNSKEYIARTLDTVMNQTKLPFEVIIVDDGSKDGTINEVKHYIETNPEAGRIVKLIQQQNTGAGAARNRGIKAAKGDWISFLDSDDLWDSGKLKKTIEVVKERPDAVIITHDEYVIQEKRPGKKVYCPLHTKYVEQENLFLQLYRHNLFSTSCMTVKREILIKEGGFDTTLLSAQDYDMWIRVGKSGNAVFIKEPLETYVLRKGNITSNTYRRYQCEMKICKKYIPDLLELLGREEAKRYVKKRIFQIHKSEVYLALKNKQFVTCFNILIRFPYELSRGNLRS